MDNYCKKTKSLVDNHIHGGFGIDFATATVDDILLFSKKFFRCGIGYFFPTLATDTIDNLKKQIEIIKKAKSQQTEDMAEIVGIHLEGPFLNPLKKGIHNEKQLLSPTIENYKLLEDDIIKIVTLAPELDENFELCKYLKSKNIKVSAGHTLTADLTEVNQVTHLFNAMGGITHRELSTASATLLNDDVFAEIICDCVHVIEPILKLIFKTKSMDKFFMISDCLAIAHSDKEKLFFCGEDIYLKGNKAVNKDGTLAGSALFISDMLKLLVDKNIIDFETGIKIASENQTQYHNIENSTELIWNDNLEIKQIIKNGKTYNI